MQYSAVHQARQAGSNCTECAVIAARVYITLKVYAQASTVQCTRHRQAATALSVQLLLHVHYSKSACSVRTGYVFFGTLVLNIIGSRAVIIPN